MTAPEAEPVGVVSGRPPSMLLGLALFSGVVAAVALGAVAITGSAAPALWMALIWAILVVAVAHRGVALYLRHHRAFRALRRARRALRTRGGHELRMMTATSPEALAELVTSFCVQADKDDLLLFIEVEEDDPMERHWAALGFCTTSVVDMPWGPVSLIARERSV